MNDRTANLPTAPRDADPRNVLLAIEKVTFRHGARVAIEDVEIAIGEDELFGLLGPNGSGKSTLLSLCAGLQRPASGGFRYRGVALTSPDRRWRRELSVVFQRPSLDERLTIWENLGLHAQIHALPGSWRERARELLQLGALLERRDEAVSTLSGGMKRKVDLARALLSNPRLLLLDEPTSGLDERSYRAFWEYLRSWRTATRAEAPITVIVATHRSDEAEQCDRLAILDRGRVITVSRPSTLKSRVAPDRIVLRAAKPNELAEALAPLALPHSVIDGALHVECDDGQRWLPQVVEVAAPCGIRAIEVRSATLGDVFVALTGHALEATLGDETAGANGGRA
ncbi:MAG: ATP-binding cassette domain-containing protein [Myxococcales bacterium]|nr:ATP-binding cassette domain-containing protein [Myxococcales bacterium]